MKQLSPLGRASHLPRHVLIAMRHSRNILCRCKSFRKEEILPVFPALFVVFHALFFFVSSRKAFQKTCQVMTQSGRCHGCSVATPFGVAKSGMKRFYARYQWDTIPDEIGRLRHAISDRTTLGAHHLLSPVIKLGIHHPKKTLDLTSTRWYVQWIHDDRFGK